jgi:hypothetical protein
MSMTDRRELSLDARIIGCPSRFCVDALVSLDFSKFYVIWGLARRQYRVIDGMEH